ncbi:Uncharacterised protein [Rodentibacter pneumotropicus]|uniref:Uncharacterized protein n=1 Tax=Rodentibacter pneumotropicus TaxID=758 RepID=A0A448MMT6_9PAST|nr:Uncharacterised protein [Rodentibacter pneumotropicus]
MIDKKFIIKNKYFSENCKYENFCLKKTKSAVENRLFSVILTRKGDGLIMEGRIIYICAHKHFLYVKLGFPTLGYGMGNFYELYRIIVQGWNIYKS